MMGKHQPWQWADGPVDAQAEHIELRHGDAGSTSCEDWLPIARIGRSTDRCFPVQWLIEGDSAERRAILADARRDWRIRMLEQVALHSMAAGDAAELETLSFGSTQKNLSHYLLTSGWRYWAAEVAFDIADTSRTPVPAGMRALGITSSFSADDLIAAGANWTAPDLAHVPQTVWEGDGSR